MNEEKKKVNNIEQLEKDNKTFSKGKLIIAGLTIAALCRLLVAGAYIMENNNLENKQNNEPNVTITQDYEKPEIKEMPEGGYANYLRGR